MEKGPSKAMADQPEQSESQRRPKPEDSIITYKMRRSDRGWANRGWKFTVEELTTGLPSLKENMSLEEDAILRKKSHSFIFELGKMLRLKALVMAAAMTIFQRYYAQVSFRYADRMDTTIAAFFLAAKVEEFRQDIDVVILNAYKLQNAEKPPHRRRQLVKGSREYNDIFERIIKAENSLVNAIGFDFMIEHAYAQATDVIDIMRHKKGWITEPQRILALKGAIHLLNMSLKGTMCLEHPPCFRGRHVLYLAFLCNNIPAPACMDGDWVRALELFDERLLNRASCQLVECLDDDAGQTGLKLTKSRVVNVMLMAGHIKHNKKRRSEGGLEYSSSDRFRTYEERIQAGLPARPQAPHSGVSSARKENRGNDRDQLYRAQALAGSSSRGNSHTSSGGGSSSDEKAFPKPKPKPRPPSGPPPPHARKQADGRDQLRKRQRTDASAATDRSSQPRPPPPRPPQSGQLTNGSSTHRSEGNRAGPKPSSGSIPRPPPGPRPPSADSTSVSGQTTSAAKPPRPPYPKPPSTGKPRPPSTPKPPTSAKPRPPSGPPPNKGGALPKPPSTPRPPTTPKPPGTKPPSSTTPKPRPPSTPKPPTTPKPPATARPPTTPNPNAKQVPRAPTAPHPGKTSVADRRTAEIEAARARVNATDDRDSGKRVKLSPPDRTGGHLHKGSSPTATSALGTLPPKPKGPRPPTTLNPNAKKPRISTPPPTGTSAGQSSVRDGVHTEILKNGGNGSGPTPHVSGTQTSLHAISQHRASTESPSGAPAGEKSDGHSGEKRPREVREGAVASDRAVGAAVKGLATSALGSQSVMEDGSDPKRFKGKDISELGSPASRELNGSSTARHSGGEAPRPKGPRPPPTANPNAKKARLSNGSPSETYGEVDNSRGGGSLGEKRTRGDEAGSLSASRDGADSKRLRPAGNDVRASKAADNDLSNGVSATKHPRPPTTPNPKTKKARVSTEPIPGSANEDGNGSRASGTGHARTSPSKGTASEDDAPAHRDHGSSGGGKRSRDDAPVEFPEFGTGDKKSRVSEDPSGSAMSGGGDGVREDGEVEDGEISFPAHGNMAEAFTATI